MSTGVVCDVTQAISIHRDELTEQLNIVESVDFPLRVIVCNRQEWILEQWAYYIYRGEM